VGISYLIFTPESDSLILPRSIKRKREDEDDGQEERDIPWHPFCPDCGRHSHYGDCLQRCMSCDRYHEGKCTAFCRKCTGIGHSWQHCHLFVPSRNPRRNRRRQNTAPNTYVGQVQITVPVINTTPVTTPAALNEDILDQLKVALADLQYQGVTVPARVTMTNVSITTNLITRGAAAAATAQSIRKDTSLLERVQKIPTGPRSDAPAFKPKMSQQPSAQSYSQYGFAQSAFSQPVFGRHAFGEPFFEPSPFLFEPATGFRPISTWPPMRNDSKYFLDL
jgi:hypothetical protein